MANDDIQRTIYKLEIDDSGYIKGVENMSASTKRFTEIQNAANKSLQISEQALADQSEQLKKAKQDLDSYTGSDEKYRQQLTKSYNDAQAQNAKLTGFVAQARKEYEAATKAAQDFATTSAKANNLQQQPGARIAPQVQPSQPAALSAQLFNTINIPDLTAQAEVIARTKQEFDELRDSIQLAEERMKQLNAEDEEFKALAPIVEQGKIALKQYDDAAAQAGGETESLRSRLRLAREELVRLEQAGKGASTEYLELEKRTAKLTDEFNDQQQRIKILASDTKLLDFGKGAITAATSAFQAYTSISILAGDQSEELQKKTLQLFAAMQLLQSLEQLSNLTRREGVLATLAQSGATTVYNTVVGTTTGTLKAFRLALLATGIGAAIVAIGFLVQKFQQHVEAIKEAEKEQKVLNEITTKAADAFGNAKLAVVDMTEKIKLAKQGFIDKTEVLKEYNEGIGKTIGETKSLDEAEQLLIKHGPDYIQLLFLKAKAQAAGQLAAEASKKAIEDEAKDASSFVGFFERIFSNDPQKQRAEAKKKALAKDEQDTKDYFKKMEDIQAEAAEFAKTHGLVFEPIKPTKEKTIKDIKDDFEERKNALLIAIADLEKTGFESEVNIRKEFALKLKKATDDINRDKGLKPKERKELIQLEVQLNTGQLQQALSDLNKKVTDARKKLNDEINDLQVKNSEDQINLLQDEFERRKQLIDLNEKQQIAASQNNTAERLTALENERNLIGEQQYQDAKNKIVQVGEDEQTNIVIKAAQDRQQLAVDSFKKILDNYSDILFNSKLINDKAALEDIQALSKAFLSGKITYENYKKDLEKIQKKYEDKELQNTIDTLENEIRELKKKIVNTLDITGQQYDDLIKLVKQKEAELTAAKTKQAEIEPETKNKTDQETAKEIQKYADIAAAVGQLADATVQFWQKANEAESAALDRSISLQEKRVDAAQRIADRGNASYLKAEEDRLKELQVARENAARKQLGIDAALQASQILTGITGAIAKIATPGIGIAETIGAIAVIVGSLATGYALVKSLQGNQPRFKTGTKYVKREGQPSGTDTIPAWLNEGEAVIPTDKNKAYHPTIKAVYDGTVPAEHLNNFVKTYHKIKQVPQVNYTRIKEAAELKMGTDGKMAVILSEHSALLKENNELQKQILKKKIHVENKIDRDGVASMVTDYLTQKEIDKRV